MCFFSYRQCFCLVSPSIQPKESNLQPRLLNTFFGMTQAEKNVEREILKNEHLLVGKKFVLLLKATPLFLPYMIEFNYYILFGACRNEGNHCEDNWTYFKGYNLQYSVISIISMASMADLGPLKRSSGQFFNFKVEDKKRKDGGFLTKASQREDFAR